MVDANGIIDESPRFISGTVQQGNEILQELTEKSSYHLLLSVTVGQKSTS